MSIQTQFQERRKDKRIKVKDPTYAIIFDFLSISGQITDISKSGAAIRYVKNGESYPKDLDGLDIFRSDFSCRIDNIKAKIITDMEVIDKKFIGTKKLRRCGIQFEDLSRNQISQLENFIQSLSPNPNISRSPFVHLQGSQR